jgi:hypothetical protein
MDILAEVLQFL